ncbi:MULTISPECIES: hypothetical protein [unclassified Phyllobacterium]|uniref:hypothetical protein n=1 Tax=unclassified Phyllobacterium TaxID=2638441 RepID=UPI0030130DA2
MFIVTSVVYVAVLLATYHFVAIKPVSLSWSRWIEHGIYRYQTMITGLMAAGLILGQMAIQRKQYVSDKKFMLHEKMDALREIAFASELLTLEVKKMFFSSAPNVSTSLPDILSQKADHLSIRVQRCVKLVLKAIDLYNDAGTETAAAFSRKNYWEMIQQNASILREQVKRELQDFEEMLR